MTQRFAHWLAHGLRTLLTLGVLLGSSAHALDAPQGPVVLTVSGKIGTANQGSAAAWDLAMLARLPQTQFTTTTPWDKGPVTFKGPLLRDLLAAVKASGDTLRATALNDYRISIPVADAQRFDVLLATHINGQALTVRTKGPLFVIYPFDSHAELKSPTYFERSIWQLKAIAVE